MLFYQNMDLKMNRIILLIYISVMIGFPIDVNSELDEKSSLENYNKIPRIDSFSQALEQTLNPQNYIFSHNLLFAEAEYSDG